MVAHNNALQKYGQTENVFQQPVINLTVVPT